MRANRDSNKTMKVLVDMRWRMCFPISAPQTTQINNPANSQAYAPKSNPWLRNAGTFNRWPQAWHAACVRMISYLENSSRRKNGAANGPVAPTKILKNPVSTPNGK